MGIIKQLELERLEREANEQEPEDDDEYWDRLFDEAREKDD